MAGEPDTSTTSRELRAHLPDVFVSLFLTIIALFLFERLIVLDDIESYLVDYRIRSGRFNDHNPELVYVSVDKTSYAGDFPEELVRKLEGDDQYFATLIRGEWPWTREVWAHVTERLLQAGAKGVLLDFIFPTEKPEDSELRAVLDRYPDRVVIGALIDQGEGSTSLIPPATSLITPDAAGDNLGDRRVGLLNIPTDADGVVRRGLYQVDIGEHLSLTGATAMAPSLKTAVARAAEIINPDLHPVSGRLLRFTGPPGAFEPISLKSLIDSDEWRTRFAEPDYFRDKFVVIGPGSAILNDYHRTPFVRRGALMAGPELLLHQINAAVRGEFILESSPLVNRTVIIGAGAVLLLLTWWPRQTPRQILAVALVSAAFLFVVFRLSDQSNYMLTAVFTPLAILNGGILTTSILDRHRPKPESTTS